ncbi:MAG: ABC transporter ATP-binding protein [Eggerthellaceae bacterium]
MFVTAHHLSHTYEGADQPALDGVSLAFASGWTGIVGPNGAGRARSCTASAAPGTRSRRRGARMRGGVPAIDRNASGDARGVRLRLRFDGGEAALAIGNRGRAALELRYAVHGERKRIQIACALAAEPQVLALDEPTNHLDAPTRPRRAGASSFNEASGLLVSHDRAARTSLCGRACSSRPAERSLFRGRTQARRELELRQDTVRTERRQARGELARIKAERDRRAAVAARSAARRSARHLDRHDRDGREKIKLAVYTGQDGKAGKLFVPDGQAHRRGRETPRGARCEEGAPRLPEAGRRARARKGAPPASPQAACPLGPERMLHHPSCTWATRIGRARRQNRAGKSTLLHALLRRVTLEEWVAYFPGGSRRRGRALLVELRALPTAERGRVLSIVARLESPPARVLDGEELSREVRKLADRA